MINDCVSLKPESKIRRANGKTLEVMKNFSGIVRNKTNKNIAVSKT